MTKILSQNTPTLIWSLPSNSLFTIFSFKSLIKYKLIIHFDWCKQQIVCIPIKYQNTPRYDWNFSQLLPRLISRITFIAPTCTLRFCCCFFLNFYLFSNNIYLLCFICVWLFIFNYMLEIVCRCLYLVHCPAALELMLYTRRLNFMYYLLAMDVDNRQKKSFQHGI